MELIKKVAADIACNSPSDLQYPWHTVAAKAAIRAVLDGVEPVASVYTMHMEFGQTNARLADPGLTPFGIPGRDYSAEYPVTETPLYSLDALKEAVKP